MKRLAVALARPRADVDSLALEAVRPDVTVARASDAEWFADLVARAALVVLFSVFALGFALDFLATGRLTTLLMLVGEALVVALTLVRRSALTLDRSMRARVLTAVSAFGPYFFRPGQLAPLAPEALTVAIMIAGLSIVIGGKLTLGRSFGLMPANRGVVSSGLYRLVRHPIYMGYLAMHGAFLLANPTWRNIAVIVIGDIALMVRAVCEEQTLAQDPQYRAYQQQVRWRVCPGVF